MTTTTNIQTIGRLAAKETNKIEKDATMKHGNDNIEMVTRLSNSFRIGNISKSIAGAAIGLVLIIGLAMPGAASADAPSGSVASNVWLNDDFSMVFGIPDTGLELGGVGTSAPARVSIKNGSGVINDAFAKYFGLPD